MNYLSKSKKGTVCEFESLMTEDQHQVQYNDDYQIILIDQILIKCTPIQYTVFLRLLRNIGRVVTYDNLYSTSNKNTNKTSHREMLEILRPEISDLRVKMSAVTVSYSIHAVVGLGYILVDLATIEK